jgi:hypothetical protein
LLIENESGRTIVKSRIQDHIGGFGLAGQDRVVMPEKEVDQRNHPVSPIRAKGGESLI